MEALKKIFCLLLFLNAYCAGGIYYDSSGRRLEIKSTPEKIAAIGPGAARLVAYLGKTEKLIATENIEIKYPQGRPYSVAYMETFSRLPVISEGGPDKVPDYEKIISLNPQLIILCSLDPALSLSVAAKTGIPVFNADYGNLGSFNAEKFKKTIKTLGEILEAEKRASFLSKKIDSYISDLKKRSSVKKKPKVYVGGLGFKGAQGILSTQYSYEPFSLLGLNSVIDSGKEARHVFIEKEKLASLDPEYIFIDSAGLEIFLSDYASNEGFYRMLRAFSSGKVYTTLPYNYYTTNVEIVFANAYFIGKTLFPERFSDIDTDRKAAEIIKDFVGRDIYPQFTLEKRFFKKAEIKDGIYFK